jgi:hypothetical protein
MLAYVGGGVKPSRALTDALRFARLSGTTTHGSKIRFALDA